ncbi:hypothetical protein JCGZ_21704 [Jatropha curcas]|uniref:AN1-type domain-containing protein n=1 Tax=Jatropha curcas TaxID=180498 RepID=A0A067JER8_JATCU|nr:hypothetical protein JCGZ_21704 [Jatropha curcas]
MDSQNNSSSSPCKRGCGFFGSPQNHGLYLYLPRLETIASTKTTALTIDKQLSLPTNTGETTLTITSAGSTVKNRCESCNKKVGLTGFACRCGKVLCGSHRYPKEHSCTFDFKKADRDCLIKQNPLIKSDKLYFRV